ncbi:polysaccharide deacetylase family protein [Clostridium sp. BJN0001]|uniref:polysaccharide deacetylase family protein n=1 Tax=Clostridium sp. BJN0001 TaxID=2930219 RepID=UPI001FD49EE7|nr:polysaccharide deacetylase family protein [Clostridium sp. BJN0001]
MKRIIKIISTVLFIVILVNFKTYAKENKPISELNEKVVFLTFDDGPSFNNTDKILDILESNNVKATFCVIGKNAEENLNTLKRILNLNMAVIPHCYNHEYHTLYSSVNYYINDLKKCMEIIQSAGGSDMKHKFVRMPGGSDNHVANSSILKMIRSELRNEEIDYIDWNVDSGDALRTLVPQCEIEQTIRKQAGKREVEVVLMHDLENKKTTTASLQSIISLYKKLGYEFKSLNDISDEEYSYLRKHNVIDRVKRK